MPQKRRRTRNVSATSDGTSASGAPSTDAHSARVNASPAIALSASAAKLVVSCVVVMRAPSSPRRRGSEEGGTQYKRPG